MLRQVMEDARARAEKEPMRLSKNWAMAVFIFVFWVAGLEACLYYGLGAWGESPNCRMSHYYALCHT